MRVQITEQKLKDTDPFTGQRYDKVKGDEIDVHDDYGARLCRLGWAKDLSGKTPTGERTPGPEALNVKKAVVGSKGRT